MAEEQEPKLRVAAVADLHSRDDQHGRFRHLIKLVNASADVLVLCGDLTDHGRASEARTLAEDLSGLRIPCAAVLGNHDYEGGVAQEICAEITKVGVHLLDGDQIIIDKRLGIAGVKGFCGGFGTAMLQAFGEPVIKSFVQEGVAEALKLESALAQLDAPKKIVIMHYSPVVETCQGENPELRPFLGTSRLAIPIDQFGAQAVFHGHSHHGSHEGRTPGGVPVYNVALPVVSRIAPEQRFIVVQI